MHKMFKILLLGKKPSVLCCTKYCAIAIIISIIIILRIQNSATERLTATLRIQNPRRRLVLGILADHNLLNTLVNASQQTWIPSFKHDIYYFVGRKNNKIDNYPKSPNIIELSANDDDYPPVMKTFQMWGYFYQQHIENYDYFMSVDADSYVHVDNLEAMLKATQCDNCYVGLPCVGILHERHTLGLSGPYCSGMGYLVARNTLQKFGPKVDVCRSSTVSWHSDTEVGRCIYEHASGIVCINPQVSSFLRVTFTTAPNGTIIKGQLNKRKQIDIRFPEAPPTKFFGAAVIHPLKFSHSFHQFHQQCKLQLRPILPLAFLPESCVANPTIQNEIYPLKYRVPECNFLIHGKPMTNPSSVAAFAIQRWNSGKYLKTTVQHFAEHGLILQTFHIKTNTIDANSIGLTTEQSKIRVTMKYLIIMAIKKKLKQVLIINERLVPHKNFRQLFQTVLNDKRCQGSTHGGVLLLGVKMSEKGWNIIDTFKKTEIGICRNICTHVSETYGVLLHNSVYKPILTWLREGARPEPFDRVYVHLSKLGFPVRFAFPNLIINNPSEALTSESPNRQNRTKIFQAEAVINRWKLEDYGISL